MSPSIFFSNLFILICLRLVAFFHFCVLAARQQSRVWGLLCGVIGEPLPGGISALGWANYRGQGALRAVDMTDCALWGSHCCLQSASSCGKLLLISEWGERVDGSMGQE